MPSDCSNILNNFDVNNQSSFEKNLEILILLNRFGDEAQKKKCNEALNLMAKMADAYMKEHPNEKFIYGQVTTSENNSDSENKTHERTIQTSQRFY